MTATDPCDDIWMQDQMKIRQAVANSAGYSASVYILDDYCQKRGLARIGKVETESWDYGSMSGVASYCKIVDVRLFTDSIAKDARQQEYRRIRNLPWWRRLFMPKETVL